MSMANAAGYVPTYWSWLRTFFSASIRQMLPGPSISRAIGCTTKRNFEGLLVSHCTGQLAHDFSI